MILVTFFFQGIPGGGVLALLSTFGWSFWFGSRREEYPSKDVDASRNPPLPLEKKKELLPLF